ncbi:Methyltransferase domain-containing protein [Haloechinothrix alba]|uniref:Methyltransferase domain-containing protein n=1 Tax=Haloechinothrix alba TaxID=664784 RepID=A0A238XC19_9PSEU|nr:class I SAM-dependent methyltransferase [Haloechinothrix alba]SNR55874.1 Methyltransferase domain-containing protein [Haloechinothrix alba]
MRSEDWDAKFAASEPLFSDSPNQFVAAELADMPPGTALDVAAGQGRNAVWLAEQGWRVTAVDFSPVGLSRAEALAAERAVDLNLVRADVTSWRPPAAAFDLVLVAYLQIPHGELVPVLRAAAGAVAPGGSMFVVGHDRDNLTHGTGGPQDVGVLYTVDVVAGALDALRVHRAEQVTRTIPTDDGHRTAIDTLVMATTP